MSFRIKVDLLMQWSFERGEIIFDSRWMSVGNSSNEIIKRNPVWKFLILTNVVMSMLESAQKNSLWMNELKKIPSR